MTQPIQSLHSAKQKKNDDFYTQLSDIENELQHYEHHFAGKVVYCNCDDPRVSNFYKYFSLKFESLKLKKLITTCYKNQNIDMFSDHASEKAIWLEYNRGTYEDGAYIPADPVVRHLNGDGDFRSPECIELLQQADIVVTNPPFSLFREYVAQLTDYEKQFLIVGTWNAITYKEVFKLFMDNRVWLGINSNRNFSGFIIPAHYPLHGTEARIDADGNRIVSTNNTCWFTNLDITKRHEDLILYRKYSPENYPHYDNYDAINVDKTKNIPKDWGGVMGVPITFLDKHNPDQFEILGLSQKVGFGLESHQFYDDYEETRQDGSKTGSSGKKTNGNPVMKGRPHKGNFYVKGDDVVHSLYGRIFIRRIR